MYHFYPSIFNLDNANLHVLPPVGTVPFRRLIEATDPNLPVPPPPGIVPWAAPLARRNGQRQIRQPVGWAGPGGAHRPAGRPIAGQLNPPGPGFGETSLSNNEIAAIQLDCLGYMPISGYPDPATTAVALMTTAPLPNFGAFFDRLPEFLAQLGYHTSASDYIN